MIKYIYDQTYDVQGGIGYASAMSFIYFGVMVLSAGNRLSFPDAVGKRGSS